VKFVIPSIGDKIVLTKAWEFPLIIDYRNKLTSRLRPGLEFTRSHTGENSVLAIIERGTVLRVDRIYIRQGKSEWDSLTFSVTFAPKDKSRVKPKTGVLGQEEKLKGARFWAKLKDVNRIQFKPYDE